MDQRRRRKKRIRKKRRDNEGLKSRGGSVRGTQKSYGDGRGLREKQGVRGKRKDRRRRRRRCRIEGLPAESLLVYNEAACCIKLSYTLGTSVTRRID